MFSVQIGDSRPVVFKPVIEGSLKGTLVLVEKAAATKRYVVFLEAVTQRRVTGKFSSMKAATLARRRRTREQTLLPMRPLYQKFRSLAGYLPAVTDMVS